MSAEERVSSAALLNTSFKESLLFFDKANAVAGVPPGTREPVPEPSMTPVAIQSRGGFFNKMGSLANPIQNAQRLLLSNDRMNPFSSTLQTPCYTKSPERATIAGM